MPCGIICGRITPARGYLEHRPLSGAVIVMMIVMTHLVSTIMIKELKTSVTTISRGITTP